MYDVGDALLFKGADPLAVAEQNGVIRKTEIGRENQQSGDVTYATVRFRIDVVKEPGHAGIEITETTVSDNHRIEVSMGGGNPVVAQIRLSLVVALIRKYVEYPTQRTALGDWLADQVMQPSSVIQRFEAVAGAARMCLCARYLCSAEEHADHLTDLRIAPIVSTRDELASLIKTWTYDPNFTDSIWTAPTFADSRIGSTLVFSSDFGNSNLSDKIRSGIMALWVPPLDISVFAPAPQFRRGPKLIDDTLRRLAGTMRMRGVPVDLPNLPPDAAVVDVRRETEAVQRFAISARDAFSSLSFANGVTRGSRIVLPSSLTPYWGGAVISVSAGNPVDAYAMVDIGIAFDLNDARDLVTPVWEALRTLPNSSFMLHSIPSQPLESSPVLLDASESSGVRVRVVSSYSARDSWADVHLFVLSPHASLPPPVPQPTQSLLMSQSRHLRRAVARKNAAVAFAEASAGRFQTSEQVSTRLDGLRRAKAPPPRKRARVKK